MGMITTHAICGGMAMKKKGVVEAMVTYSCYYCWYYDDDSYYYSSSSFDKFMSIYRLLGSGTHRQSLCLLRRVCPSSVIGEDIRGGGRDHRSLFRPER